MRICLEAVEIENRFQLTPQGKYWLDVGFLLEGEFAINGENKKKLRYGPLLQKQFGRTLVTTNFLFQNQFGSDAKNHDEDTFFSYAANVRYLLSPFIEPGISESERSVMPRVPQSRFISSGHQSKANFRWLRVWGLNTARKPSLV